MAPNDMDIFDELDVSAPRSGGVALYPPGATFGPRRMREWEFVWMMQGDARYRRNEQEAEAPEGSVVLCRPDATDWFEWDTRRETRHAYFHFDVASLPAVWRCVEWPLARTDAPGDLLIPMFRFLAARINRVDETQAKLTIGAMLAAFLTGDRSTELAGQRAHTTTVTMACDFIRRSLEGDATQPLTLGQVAAAVSVTPEHLCRVFQASVGVSPAKFVRLARLERAASLLAHSNYTITQIAEMCGFASPFHFSRRFKEAYGVAPSHVRDQIRLGAMPAIRHLLDV